MALEGLTDQIKERATAAWGKIQDSATYNSLRERYETLPPNAQRGIIVGAVVVVLLILVSFPYSDISTSREQISVFNDDRALLRQLLRASRLASETATTGLSVSPEALKVQIQTQLTSAALQPEQIAGISDVDGKTVAGSLAAGAQGVQLSGVAVNLKKLNLKQVVDIGFDLQKISPSVKMAGLSVTAAKPDAHYFDVEYRLVAFGMPDSSNAEDEGGSGAGQGKGRGGKGGGKKPSGGAAGGGKIPRGKMGATPLEAPTSDGAPGPGDGE